MDATIAAFIFWTFRPAKSWACELFVATGGTVVNAGDGGFAHTCHLGNCWQTHACNSENFCSEALQVERIWASWSRNLNLQENNAKRQYFHPQHKGRQEFIDFGIPASQVSHDILILGHGFKGFVCTAKNYQQRSWTDYSIRCDDPHNHISASCVFLKKRIIAAASMAKAEFSWLVKVLPLAVCKRVQKSIKIAVLTWEPPWKDIDCISTFVLPLVALVPCAGVLQRHLPPLCILFFATEIIGDFLGLITPLGFGNVTGPVIFFCLEQSTTHMKRSLLVMARHLISCVKVLVPMNLSKAMERNWS